MTTSLYKPALLSLAAALALAGCNSGADTATPDTPKTDVKIDNVAAPAGKKWEEMVTKTAEGGFRIGNPDAKVKVVEYGALSCSHCADFSKASSEVLKSKYIASGQVSYEMRNYILNSLDIVPSAITHCVGAERYFPLTENIFASQGELFTLAQAADPNALKNLQALPQRDQIPGLAKIMKLDQFFKARGVTDAEFNSCLSNTANLTALEKTVTEGNTLYNITGTPTFIVDGAKIDLSVGKPLWDSLKAVIDEKLG